MSGDKTVETLRVDLGERSYDILIGDGLIDRTLPRPLRKGDVKFTALGYRQIALRSCHRPR